MSHEAVNRPTPTKPASKRIGVFRRVAVERYRAPLELDTPSVLQPWRPGVLWAAWAIMLATGIAWLF